MSYQFSQGLGLFLPLADATQSIIDLAPINIYSSNTNVGIGNSAPQAKLDIAGDLKASANITTQNNLVSLGGTLTLNATNFTDTTLLGYSNTAYFASNLGVYASNTFVKKSGDYLSGTLTVASNSSHQFLLPQSNASCLLFGASNSDTIYGDAPIISTSGRFNGGAPGQLLLSSCDNGQITMNVHNSTGTGTEIARFNNVGLGINTVSPSEKLDVAGNANIQNNLFVKSNLIVTHNVTLSNNLTNLGPAYFASNVVINGQLQSSNLRMGATTYTEASMNNTVNQSSWSSNMLQNYLPLTGGTLVNSLTLNAAGPIATNFSNNKGANVSLCLAHVDGQWSSSAQSNDFIIRNWNTTGKIHLQNGVAAAALTVNSNNFIGINNSAPVESLHVTGKIYATQQILADSNDSSNTPAFSFLQDSNSGMWQPSNDTLGFAIGGVDRIRINDQGFFGILTSNPTVPLDVVGQIKTSSGLVINSSTYTDTSLNSWSNTLYSLCNTTTGVSSTALFASNTAVFASNARLNYLPLTGGTLSGFLGISTATSSGYSIGNNKGGGVDFGLAYAPGAYSTFANSNDLVVRNNNALGRLHFQSGVTSSALTINSNNFVGIGTNIPQYSLDIQGSVGINKGTAVANKLLTLFDLGPTDTAATACNFYGFGINPAVLRYQAPINTTHSFYNGITNTMNLNATGLGIGTTPTTALNVNGNAVINSNLSTQSTGTLFMPITLNTGYFDLINNTSTVGLVEPGNPCVAGSSFHSNLFNGSNCSGENINWTRARLLIRGCSLNTMNTATNVNLNIRCYNSNTNTQSTLVTMTARDWGSHQGYTTNLSPFFSISNLNRPYLGLQLVNSGLSYRVGQVTLLCSL